MALALAQEPTGPGYTLLSDYLAQPELLVPPPCILPHLAWEGRVTLLSAAEKGGKSTLVGQGVAAMVGEQREFLDGEARPGSVLWLAMDEPVTDLVRRLDKFGARSGVGIYNSRPSTATLDRDIQDIRPSLIVIDTLTRFALGEVTEGGSRMQWAPLMAFISGLARANNIAVLVLHHFARSAERYSESAEIGASVDQIVDMKGVSDSPSGRILDSRGRVTFEKFRLEYGPNEGYEPAEGRKPSLDLTVYEQVAKSPGSSGASIAKAVGKRKERVLDILTYLQTTGMAHTTENGRWYPGPKPVEIFRADL